MKELLGNLFIRSIVIPIFLALTVAYLKPTVDLVKGRMKQCSGDPQDHCKFRIWVGANGRPPYRPITDQSIRHIVQTHKLDTVAIQPLPDFSFGELATVGLDLLVGAFAIDLASLIASNPTQVSLFPMIFMLHLVLFVPIILVQMLNHLDSPGLSQARNRRAVISLGLGLVAMMTAFMMVPQ